MTSPNPAFPTIDLAGKAYEGITKREYFAAKAMQAIISTDRVHNGYDIANAAYMMADAMLEAGNNE